MIKDMSNTITTNKFVELTYRIIDQTNGEVIEQVEEPLGYVQGDNTLLFNQVTKELEGKLGKLHEADINPWLVLKD